MTTNQEIKLNMYLAVRNFINANEALSKTLPKFSVSYSMLLSTIGEIQVIAEIQRVDKKGLAVTKNQLRKNLMTIAGDYSRKIAAFARFSGNNELFGETKFSKSDLARMTDVALKDYLKIIYNKAETNIESLAEYGITKDSQQNFMDSINKYDTVLSSPRTGIAEKSKATKRLVELFKSADSAMENMDLSVGIVKLTQPDFFNGYSSARKLVDTSSGFLTLKAIATDLKNGEPVRGVIFNFIPENIKSSDGGNGEIIKKTADKGSFYIKSMPSGVYRVVIRKPGYKEQEIIVSVPAGERTDLKVELEKV